MNPFFPLPPGPPPMFGQQTRYIYRTRDGGPPSDGKPPAPPGPPPPYPGFCFGGPPPGPPPPGPFCFGAPPPPPGPPAPGPAWMFQPPPAPGPPGPTHMCFQNPSGTTCVPTSAAPPAPPAASVTVTATPASGPFNPATYTGPICHAGGASGGGSRTAPAPGNRVNERIVKADDGSGILLSPDQTCFHVLEPGQQFGAYTSRAALVRNVQFKVQYADSDWSVEKVITLLGGLSIERTGATYANKRELVGIQEWHEGANGCFQEGSLIMLNDPKSKVSLREMGWGPDHGRAGQKPPVWVMLWP